MKILSSKNVYAAAIDRINYLYNEFPNIVVGMSGGKDSTTVFELTMRVARERGRLPLTVFFLDQEAEWTATIDYVRRIMHHPDVRPLWMQMPIHLDNAASFTTRFLKCWDPAEEGNWIREKDPISRKENIYGTDRFKELFPAIFNKEYAGQKLAVLAGVRCEESPSRLMGLTNAATYKWITWGMKLGPDQYTFYPLYDWSYTDIWHAIQSEKWPYNRIYDYQYRYGIPVNQMRVSNLHHETAVRSLFHLQEIDPPLYERLAGRLPGVDTAGKFGADFYARKLPFMFKDWCEYRDFLIEKLVADDPKWTKELKALSKKWDDLLDPAPLDKQRAANAIIQSILCNDYTGTKTNNFRTQFIEKYRHDRAASLQWTDGRVSREQDPHSFKWFETHIKGRWAVIEDGRRCFYPTQPGLNQHKYWIEGDTLCRTAITTSVIRARADVSVEDCQ
jgi:predicted phosphoadenosine phosphosulfate sulfurtransferase